MIKRLAVGLGALVLSLSGLAHAQGISQKVGVCDPAYTSRCIKPDASGNLPVTGTVTATNASVGANGSAAKTSSTLAGVSDGTNQQQVLAPIALSPTAGVNGNNTVSVANWIWNGSAYVAQSGTTAGAYVLVAPTSGAGAAITPTTTGAAASNLVAKASAGNLYGFHVTSGASAGYVLTFNATSLPADGAVTPAGCYAIPANSTLTMDFRPIPRRFGTGITIGLSTTGCFTQTASATAFISAEVQ